ncbi:MAG: thiamine ABC transporter substrate-binding protein [Candidatus Marsarchaeota archaeon]|nr:thiamine ABC transporter substrate-binding protein [Candidatus Marsarchaeota archaeon]
MNWRVTLALIVAALVALSAAYAYSVSTSSSKPELTVYTYQSLFTYAPNVTAVNNTVFGGFEHQYHVKIKVVRFDSTQAMLNQLVEEKNNPQAGIVIGLTNTEAEEAVSKGVLMNYTPPNLKSVPAYLVNDLQPQHYLVPYEYSPITLDYCNVTPSYADGLGFQSLESPNVSSHLLIENPLTDSTGLSFLLYEITFYSYVVHENWLSWWLNVSKEARIVPDWDYAFTIFPAQGYHYVVSYGTDPAYFKYFGGYPGCGTEAMHYQGKTYVWLEIEGMGIVAGSNQIRVAEEFENWFLSPTVQSLIPTSEWMFPANGNVTLPSVYASAVGAENSVVLNNYISPSQIGQNLSAWLNEWQEAVS